MNTIPFVHLMLHASMLQWQWQRGMDRKKDRNLTCVLGSRMARYTEYSIISPKELCGGSQLITAPSLTLEILIEQGAPGNPGRHVLNAEICEDIKNTLDGPLNSNSIDLRFRNNNMNTDKRTVTTELGNS